MRLWHQQRLLSQSRRPLNNGKENDSRFKEALIEYTKHAEAIRKQSAESDAGLEAFMDKQNITSDGCNWHNFAYNSDLTLADAGSKLKTLMRWFKKEFPYYYGACVTCGQKEDESSF